MNDLKETIMQRATLMAPQFEAVLEKSSSFEIKGVLNSEMLMFVTLCNILNVEHIIESGRARAQSTEVITRWLCENAPKTRFDSIEFDSNSNDVDVAKRRIEATGYPVNLLFGDAFELLPSLLNEQVGKTIVLIDGPKGVDAAKLALAALEDSNIAAVCIHDVHKDDPSLRAALEMWPRFIASDEDQFVKQFSHLDTLCWAEHQKYDVFRGWGPYKRSDRTMKSYGPTLVCLVNDVEPISKSEVILQIKRSLDSITRHRKLLHSASKLVPRAIKDNSKLRKLILRV